MSGAQALRERGALLDELHQIVQAMKNFAFAELQRIARMRPAQTQACEAVLEALEQLTGQRRIAPVPDAHAAAKRQVAPGSAWLVIGAERGFCGSFNARLAAATLELRRVDPQALLLVASRRVIELLGTEAAASVALPGCAGTEDADAVLDEWVAALAQVAPQCCETWLLHTDIAGLVQRRLLPVLAGAVDAIALSPPLHYLPRATLQAALEQQSLRLLLQSGLMASLETENHDRLTQMQRAQDHLDELGRVLHHRLANVRQADITNELETLVSSLDVDRAGDQQ